MASPADGQPSLWPAQPMATAHGEPTPWAAQSSPWPAQQVGLVMGWSGLAMGWVRLAAHIDSNRLGSQAGSTLAGLAMGVDGHALD
jgi:hypothetical protein